MTRLGLVEILRLAAQELESAAHARGGGVGTVKTSEIGAIARHPRLAGLRPRPVAESATARPSLRDRRTLLERSPIPLSPDVRAAQAAVSQDAPPASVSGFVALSERVVFGDVLVTDPYEPTRVRPGRDAADFHVVGVVSGEPRGNDTLAPATFMGAALVNADAAYGAIAEGDFLTSSPTRGHAMLSTCRAPGTILGRALEALPMGRGRIRVLVSRR
jgi:hypothetical protein